MAKDREQKLKLIKMVQVILGIMCFVVILMVAESYLMKNQRYGVGVGTYHTFNEGWMLESANGIRAVECPGKVRILSGSKMVLHNTLPEVEDGQSLFVHSVLQDVKVYVDGELLENYTNKDKRIVGKVSPSAWINVRLTKDMSGKDVMLVAESFLSRYAGTLSNSYVGDSTAIWYHLFRKNIVLIAEGLTILSLGIAFILLYVIGRKRFPFLRKLFYLGQSALCIGGWILCNNECRQIYTSNLELVHNLSYALLLVMEIPLLLYVNEMQRRRFNNGIIYLCVVNAIAFFGSLALVRLDIYDFLELFIVTECLLVASAIVIIVTSILCMQRQKNMYLYYGGIIFILIAGVGEITRLLQRYNESYGHYLGAGTTIFLILTAIGVARDVIASFEKRKRTEAEHMAKNDFLSSMSHELRTPMHAISGMIDMMAESKLSVENRERIEMIQEYTDNMLNIVNSILELSDVKSGDLIIQNQEYPLQEVLYDTVTLGKQRLGDKKVEMKVELGENVPSILKGDQARVKQVLNHLLHNAVKFTDEGSIRIKVDFTTTDWKRGELKVSISDTGCGIREKDLNRIFKDFVKSQKEDGTYPEGTGIGLVICKRLLKRMKGNLEVQSKWGEGSTFTITLPQEVVEFQPLKEIENTREFGKQNYVNFKIPKAKILVVDDNATNLQIASQLLRRYDCLVSEASSGLEALQILESEKFDLVLLDIMMPGMDGLEVARRVRKMDFEEAKTLPIVALTANAMNSMKTQCLEAGMNDYVTKPMRAEVLDRVLKQYIPKWKIEALTEKEVVKEAKENAKLDAEKRFLKKLKGINVEEGLHYCLDKVSVYINVVRTFANQDMSKDLQKAYEEKDIKNYTIWMHSLKSSAHNIGADKLSEMAFALEMAGKSEEMDLIHKSHKVCMDLYGKILKQVSEALREVEDTEGTEKVVKTGKATKTEWKKASKALAEALMDMQPDRIKEAFEKFKACAPEEEEIISAVQTIQNDIENFDYDKAGEKVSKYI